MVRHWSNGLRWGNQVFSLVVTDSGGPSIEGCSVLRRSPIRRLFKKKNIYIYRNQLKHFYFILQFVFYFIFLQFVFTV